MRINIQFFVQYKYPHTITYHNFWNKLAWISIKNDLVKAEREEVEERRMPLSNNHDHAPAQPHASNFENRKSITNSNQEYQQYLCLTLGHNKKLQTLHLYGLALDVCCKNTLPLLKKLAFWSNEVNIQEFQFCVDWFSSFFTTFQYCNLFIHFWIPHIIPH